MNIIFYSFSFVKHFIFSHQFVKIPITDSIACHYGIFQHLIIQFENNRTITLKFISSNLFIIMTVPS